MRSLYQSEEQGPSRQGLHSLDYDGDAAIVEHYGGLGADSGLDQSAS